jgi:flagellar L-ring protein precursor FlgH
MKQQRIAFCAGLFGLTLLSACSSPQPMIVGPTSVRPAYPVTNIESNGAIFRVSSAKLFEEPTTHNVGDILKIEINESLTGSNKSSTTTSRDSSLKQVGPGPTTGSSLSGLLASIYNVNATASGSDSFKGSGQTENANTVTGTLMVTITEVLPNGNLTVAGEKRIGMNGSVNVLRFSGVVRERDIRGGNVVASSNVADARLEQVGGGAVADANGLNSLQQFFHSLLTFW